MANGMLSGGLPPGLQGFAAGRAQFQNDETRRLQGMLSQLSLQEAAETAPMKRALLAAQVKQIEDNLRLRQEALSGDLPAAQGALAQGAAMGDVGPTQSNAARMSPQAGLLSPQQRRFLLSGDPGLMATARAEIEAGKRQQPRVQFDSERGLLIDLDTGASRPILGVSPKEKEPKAPRTQYDAERGVIVNLDTGVASPISGIGPKPEKPTAQQQQQVLGVSNTRNAIETYREALKNFGALDVINPAKRAEIGTAYNNMLLQAKEAYNLGVLNGPDYMILQQVITNPASVTGAITPRKSLESQLTQLDSIMERVGQTVRGSASPTPERRQSDRRNIGGFTVLRD